MSLAANPFLFYNLGAEMVYILSQRLEAQFIAAEKQQRVIGDLLTNLFSRNFASEQFAPQPTYAYHSFKHILTRVVQSSVLKLSDASMTRLLQLMTSTVKFQMINVGDLEGALDLFKRHISGITAVMGGTLPSSIQSRVNTVSGMFDELMGELNPWDRLVTFQDIIIFFQSHHIKVSLLLQYKAQYSDGTPFILSHRGKTYAGPLKAPPEPAPEYRSTLDLPPMGTNLYALPRPSTSTHTVACPLAQLATLALGKDHTVAIIENPTTNATGILGERDIGTDIQVALSVFDSEDSPARPQARGTDGSPVTKTSVDRGRYDAEMARFEAGGGGEQRQADENDLLDLLDDLE
ncbi:Organic solute carrier protein 1 [Carpediemonas membranifera]|uniref:Organic solute carrier protein 1 n=1 Tax=Carpediemonas membranifera TaxID=201153 RepID=A0A8J6B7A9_9EUKA|nr:Organic solute carrier protein 1 [Carpediemonas membranifera]|eukprot:KAG9395764.1 Organic solute carrier protein 1 [Carpediemonas membranifera]